MLREEFKELLKKPQIYCFTPDFLIQDKKKKLTAIEKILNKGYSIIQLREKNMGKEELIDFGYKVKELAKKYNTFLIVNDSVELALKLDADGVHLGQTDFSVLEARKKMKDKLVGLSITTYEEFLESKNYDLDYIGVGPIFPTKTKKVDRYASIELLERITRETSLPVAVIGGIDLNNMKKLSKYNIQMYCMISAMYNN